VEKPKSPKERAHESRDSKPDKREMVLVPSPFQDEALKALFGMGARLAGDAAVKGAGSTMAALQSEGPMPHRIEASWSEDDHFCIAIRFINATWHGGYVEKINTTQPRDIGFGVATSKRNLQGGFGDAGNPKAGKFNWQKDDIGIPFYVPPGESVLILLRLIDDKAKTLSRSKIVEFAYEFSIVGGKDAHKKMKGEAKATLRSAGPEPRWN
jgi:hypothetical protein